MGIKPKYKYDLHLHSSFSDGDYPPEKVIKLAKERGMKAAVIADHNVISGIRRGLLAAKKNHIWTCSGVEISTSHKGIDIHILGYAKTFNLGVLEQGLKTTREGYNQRAKEIIKRCRKLGIVDVNFQELKNQKDPGSCIFKYDLAKAIASKKDIPLPEAQKLINRGGSCYVPYGEWAITPWEAVDLIHRASGISVLAHPGETSVRTLKTLKEVQRDTLELIEILIEHHLEGLEAIYSKHTLSENQTFSKLAIKKGLVITGGSDWHGEKHHPEINMGSGGINNYQFKIFKESL